MEDMNDGIDMVGISCFVVAETSDKKIIVDKAVLRSLISRKFQGAILTSTLTHSSIADLQIDGDGNYWKIKHDFSKRKDRKGNVLIDICKNELPTTNRKLWMLDSYYRSLVQGLIKFTTPVTDRWKLNILGVWKSSFHSIMPDPIFRTVINAARKVGISIPNLAVVVNDNCLAATMSLCNMGIHAKCLVLNKYRCEVLNRFTSNGTLPRDIQFITGNFRLSQNRGNLIVIVGRSRHNINYQEGSRTARSVIFNRVCSELGNKMSSLLGLLPTDHLRLLNVESDSPRADFKKLSRESFILKILDEKAKSQDDSPLVFVVMLTPFSKISDILKHPEVRNGFYIALSEMIILIFTTEDIASTYNPSPLQTLLTPKSLRLQSLQEQNENTRRTKYHSFSKMTYWLGDEQECYLTRMKNIIGKVTMSPLNPNVRLCDISTVTMKEFPTVPYRDYLSITDDKYVTRSKNSIIANLLREKAKRELSDAILLIIDDKFCDRVIPNKETYNSLANLVNLERCRTLALRSIKGHMVPPTNLYGDIVVLLGIDRIKPDVRKLIERVFSSFDLLTKSIPSSWTLVRFNSCLATRVPSVRITDIQSMSLLSSSRSSFVHEDLRLLDDVGRPDYLP